MTTRTMTNALYLGIAVSTAAFLFLAVTPAEAITGSKMQKMRDYASTTKEMKEKRDNKGKQTVDMSCIAKAVETREERLGVAWGDFNTSITAALATRKTELVAAWNISSSSMKERTGATNAAWKKWKESSKKAHGELRDERKAAWETFRKTSKDSCRITLPREEALENTSADTLTL